MKKILFALLLAIVSVGAYAQQGSVSGHAKLGYQSDYKRFGVGVEGRYEIIDNVRLAPDAVIFFPKNKTWGLDINLNAQYTFTNIVDKLTLYPLAGVNISNNRTSSDTFYIGKEKYKTKSRGFTEFGFNVGAGADYDITPGTYVNFEMKYTFADWDYGQFMFGYGLRF